MEMGHEFQVMVRQLNPGVWVLGFNHHAKKGSKMVVMMDLHGPEPIFTASFGTPFVSMDSIMFNIDVGGMINDLITSGEKGAEYSSKRSTIVM